MAAKRVSVSAVAKKRSCVAHTNHSRYTDFRSGHSPHALASGVKYCPPKDEVLVLHLQLKKQTAIVFSNDLVSDKLVPILSSKYRLINFIYR